MAFMSPFTVIGVASTHDCPRVHLKVNAYSAQDAIRQAEGELNNVENNAAPRLKLLSAIVFAGHVACAHDAHGGNSSRGDDRGGELKANHARTPQLPYTVVCVDPATHAVRAWGLNAAAAGNAERHPQCDFFLVGSVMEGHHFPIAMREPQTAGESTRDQRIEACARNYSRIYAGYLGTNLPMHQPLPSKNT